MRHFTILLVSFVLSSLSYSSSSPDILGTTGKIKGKVTDAKSKAPLAGAIVKIEGTNLGANSDETGDYVIINVQVGTYSVKCSLIGYESLVQTDVKVSADITTNVDFVLNEKVLITDTVEIIAKRNTLSPDQSGRIVTEESILNTGIRGIENIAAKTSGVVQDERGTSINIRGGRTDETAVIIDGILTTSPLNGNSTAFVSNNLLQELAVLTGGFSAEYGNVLSGVINVTTKTGSSTYSGALEVLSDQFAKNENVKAPLSQGYKIFNASFGGPLIPTKKLKSFLTFYAGIERNDFLVSSPSWITPELGFPNEILPDYDLKRWSGNAKVKFDFANLNKKLPVQLLVGGLFSRTDRRLWFQEYMLYNSHRNPLIQEDNDQIYAKITHQISSKVFYELQGSFFNAKYEEADPDFGSNFFYYGDPAHVPELLLYFPANQANGQIVPFNDYGLFAMHNRIRPYYLKTATQYIGGNFNVVAQIKNNEFKFGGDFKYHTLRFYELRNLSRLAQVRDSSEDVQQKFFEGSTGVANYFGYNWNGQGKIDEGLDGAKHPIVAALYLQDKIEFKDFTLNAGVRVDYLYTNSWGVKSLTNIAGPDLILGPDDFIDKTDAIVEFSPRLGFSFPVTEKTIFHAQYGKFIQLPDLQLLYNSRKNLEFWVNNSGFSGSFSNSLLKPEKTTSYEIGVKQQFGDKLSFDATVYYKETKDLIGISQYPQLPNQIQVYDNKDFGTIRGLDFSLYLRRTNRFEMSVAYSLAYSSGTGSDPNSARIAAWFGNYLPKFTSPLSYDQRHTGTVNIDYRFGKTDVPKRFWGAILSRLGLNVLFSFNSGRPYTLKDPSQFPFSATGVTASLKSGINANYGPWNYRLDAKLDKTVSIWKLDVNFYVWAINLTNSELVNNVWEFSGLPGSTGYLSTQNGIIAANNFENQQAGTTKDEYIREFELREKLITNYGPPRQVRFGLRVSF